MKGILRRTSHGLAFLDGEPVLAPPRENRRRCGSGMLEDRLSKVGRSERSLADRRSAGSEMLVVAGLRADLSQESGDGEFEGRRRRYEEVRARDVWMQVPTRGVECRHV